jgi:hypothetical protein
MHKLFPLFSSRQPVIIASPIAVVDLFFFVSVCIRLGHLPSVSTYWNSSRMLARAAQNETLAPPRPHIAAENPIPIYPPSESHLEDICLQRFAFLGRDCELDDSQTSIAVQSRLTLPGHSIHVLRKFDTRR